MSIHPSVSPTLIPRYTSILLSLDALVREKLVLARLDDLGSLALLSGGLSLVVVVVVLDTGLLAALLGSGLALGSGERRVYSASQATVSNQQFPSHYA